jgi:E3 ubiquitin-protein ligase MYCBP2
MAKEELAQIEQMQMDVRIELDPNMVKCDCNATIFFEPSKVDYTAKDETGKLLSKQAAEHIAKFRIRCTSCSKNFCTSCRRSPYHVGMTCQDAQNNQDARKCRFCNKEIKIGSGNPNPAFKEVCLDKECQSLIPKSCAKIHKCGHYCRGFANEQVCLPCLEPKCVEILSKAIVDKSKAPIEGQTCSDLCSICYSVDLG